MTRGKHQGSAASALLLSRGRVTPQRLWLPHGHSFPADEGGGVHGCISLCWLAPDESTLSETALGINDFTEADTRSIPELSATAKNI